MNAMNLPGFTAEASLYKAAARRRAGRRAMNPAAQPVNAVRPAFPGQSFPDHKCACKGCDAKGGDLIGQCATVCKDNEVYAKGSESYDYCKKKEPPKPQSRASFWPLARDAGAFFRAV